MFQEYLNNYLCDLNFVILQILCDSCERWFHEHCLDMDAEALEKAKNEIGLATCATEPM